MQITGKLSNDLCWKPFFNGEKRNSLLDSHISSCISVSTKNSLDALCKLNSKLQITLKNTQNSAKTLKVYLISIDRSLKIRVSVLSC